MEYQQNKLNQALVDIMDNTKPQIITKKVDQMFFNSVIVLKSNITKSQSYQICKIIFCIVVLVVCYHRGPYDATFGVFLGALVLTLLKFLIQQSFKNYISKVEIFLELATRTNHVVEVPTQNVQQARIIEDLKCNIYAANPQLNQGGQNLFQQNALKSLIRNIYFSDRKLFSFLWKFIQLLSFGIVIFFIVELSLHNYHRALYGLVITYVVIEGLYRLVYFLLILFVTICCPCIFCCVICICVILPPRPQTAQKYGDQLKPIKYNPTIHLDHDHQCPICRSGYEDNESIVVLQCKHNFHEDCIKHWFKVGNNCPVCRFSFTR